MYEKPEYKVLEENMKIPAYKKVSFNEEKFEFKHDDLAPDDMETKKKDYDSDQFEEYEEPFIYETYNLRKLAEALITSKEKYIVFEKYLKRLEKAR
mmetsp:Transcript_41798/g.37224  ORF Transcript_41798/g.37224 Transcript_41798/m.37224 type:complete len:96 (-) Transcript_41798:278-565(-)|eukprot:CAMPEP_0114580706 /NCGR_PEP_ID=MMETSP0125-20121206/4928_1 /TAXON_ID=485358 ORGANISM="Aristerostoma sp., Strain ATCC 50986" /NCGR_SAMPLE_ID=MMETSP0125 /ASSEMBLY_ACC=CAM_ASM_000245 /LENGTH=95 /DNA_ID=CAMNT_0001772409 /DNA_START=152 /DNA_END=439 /DNA_ORIENTATION=+